MSTPPTHTHAPSELRTDSGLNNESTWTWPSRSWLSAESPALPASTKSSDAIGYWCPATSALVASPDPWIGPGTAELHGHGGLLLAPSPPLAVRVPQRVLQQLCAAAGEGRGIRGRGLLTILFEHKRGSLGGGADSEGMRGYEVVGGATRARAGGQAERKMSSTRPVRMILRLKWGKGGGVGILGKADGDSLLGLVLPTSKGE